jgi:hypothetical protein
VPLKAVLLNCTLKPSPEPSNTQALMDIVIGHLESLDVECETVRVVDHHIPFGVDSASRRWSSSGSTGPTTPPTPSASTRCTTRSRAWW